MAFLDDDLLPISALQHLVFCERQCALIHIEGLWEENRLTAEGGELHRRAHDPGHETRKGVRTVRALRLCSYELGITGVADVVEFHAPPGRAAKEITLHLLSGTKLDLQGWTIVPVEYKRGKQKKDNCDAVQLCAQALCLEEVFGAVITEGMLFYGKEQGRVKVDMSPTLRAETRQACRRLHEIVKCEINPPAIYGKRCESCSLIDICLPTVTGSPRSASEYLALALTDNLTGRTPNSDIDGKCDGT